MKKDNQDDYYLIKEGDDFFNRNKYDFNKLPKKKKSLIDQFEMYIPKNKINNILEIGCHIGDLLNYSVKLFDSKKGYGIEPSSNAIYEANKRFSSCCNFKNGVASQDLIFKDIPECELVIVNDVFCWISRETILRSISNIDEQIAKNGYIIIRDFYPETKVRNQNKHVIDQDVFCYKIVGSHVDLFLKTGNYQLISSHVFTDTDNVLSQTKEYSLSENKWIDVLLQKSWG